MRVVIDARMVLPKMTGIGRYLLGLASGLTTQSGGHSYEMWVQAGLPSDHPIWGLAGEHLTLREMPLSHMDVRQHWVLPCELSRARPDLLHYPHFDVPWFVPGDVIATIHDLKYISKPEFFSHLGRIKRLIMLVMMVFTVRRARHIIAVSESTRQDIIRYLHAIPQKVSVVHEGVESIYFKRPSQAMLRSVLSHYGLQQPYILFVGERRPHKNIPGLLRAFDIFLKTNELPYHLVIVGKRYADYQEPERLVERLGLTNNVHLLDYVPDEELPSLYRSAEAFALLSHYEGFGLPVLEAMASGTPVIASCTTSLPEVVGDAGLLIDPDNPVECAHALRQIVSGGKQRETCITKGKERARMFTWERCARETLSIYLKVIHRSFQQD